MGDLRRRLPAYVDALGTEREQLFGGGAVFGIEGADRVGMLADAPLQLVPPLDVDLHGPAEVGLLRPDGDSELVERQFVRRCGDDVNLGQRRFDSKRPLDVRLRLGGA